MTIPLCACGCDARPNSPQCWLCWQLAQGWNEETGEYIEALPFDGDVEDTALEDAEIAIEATYDELIAFQAKMSKKSKGWEALKQDKTVR